MKNLHRWLSGAFISGGMIVLGVATLILATLFASMGQPTNTSAAQQKPAAKTVIVPVVASDCDKKFVQVAGDNAGNRVDADFAVKYAKATAATHNMSKAQRTVLLENSANNAQRLAIWSNAFGLYANPNNWQPLVRGNCLSSEGQALYYRFEGTLSAKGTTLSETQASASALNSGINRGTYGVASTPGLSGNRKAVKVTLSDGSFVMILVRCGNVVFPSKPNLPAVPTDNRPPVTPTPTPTPTPTCPPGQVRNQNNICVVPKSSNPNAYQAPGRDNTRDSGVGTKPRVPTVTTQPESSPPAVITSQSGGGGVVDTATNLPGSQTGVTAPGASTTPTPVLTPEPGVNPTTGSNIGIPVIPFQ